jgi:hypothetical protein
LPLLADSNGAIDIMSDKLEIEREIVYIYFQPPLAIARLGGSDKPLDNFVWDSDKSIHGGNRTVIRPQTSLRVIEDGSLRPYLPNVIQFRDGNLLRPVAPFFELWAVVTAKDGFEFVPINLKFFESMRVPPDGILDSFDYTITVANRKAQRRTRKASCAYIARVDVSGSDFERKALSAFSPINPGEVPLVGRDRPIPLGYFQVIKPIPHKAMGVDLSALRVRFTPATGEVYGPPTAVAGPASPRPPGEALPSVTLGGRLHDIVPEKNRILNPGTPWSTYVNDASKQQDPQPADSYDGANVGRQRSWGVVDDSCDGIIEARLVIHGVRYVARARVLSSCPDFAPDRRPFYSLADDLADRDLQLPIVDETTKEETEREIVDLFERAYETASLINLDATRFRGIMENLGGLPDRSPPHMNFLSMTEADQAPGKPYARVTAALFPKPKGDPNVPPPPDQPKMDPVPYSTAARFVHGPLCDVDTLLDTLVLDSKRIEMLIRPPFGRISELVRLRSKFRNPRNPRDAYHDMRMPPFMRDSDASPLSITFRQYVALMELIDLESKERKGPKGLPRDRMSRRRVEKFLKRRSTKI